MTILRAAALTAVLATACASPRPPPAAPTNTPPDEPLMVEPAVAEIPASVELSGGTIVLSHPIGFRTGSDELADDSDAILGAIQRFLEDRTDITLLRIEVHSDAQGMTEANQALTEARALATARWLVAHGVDCARLIPVGFGETKPVADNGTAEGRARNRRVELIPAALRGRAIGGLPADGGGVVAGDPCP